MACKHSRQGSIKVTQRHCQLKVGLGTVVLGAWLDVPGSAMSAAVATPGSRRLLEQTEMAAHACVS